jgi:uncharacterized protein (DUF1330 family)
VVTLKEIIAMPVTMVTVADFATDGADALDRYVSGTLPLLEQAGAQVERYSGTEAVVGDEPFDLVAVITFPNDAAMQQFLKNDEYLALEPDRDRAFRSIKTFVSQVL